jgi:hypothetical protein
LDNELWDLACGLEFLAQALRDATQSHDQLPCRQVRGLEVVTRVLAGRLADLACQAGRMNSPEPAGQTVPPGQADRDKQYSHPSRADREAGNGCREPRSSYGRDRGRIGGEKSSDRAAAYAGRKLHMAINRKMASSPDNPKQKPCRTISGKY